MDFKSILFYHKGSEIFKGPLSTSVTVLSLNLQVKKHQYFMGVLSEICQVLFLLIKITDILRVLTHSITYQEQSDLQLVSKSVL